jgi:hypothetical protein
MQKPQKSPLPKRHKISLAKATGWILLSLGAVALVGSILYSSQISAFVGLGLIFWGAILTYIQTGEYIKKELLDATILPSLITLNQTIQELAYKGKAIYLPPKYFKNPEANKAYIPKQEDEKLPPSEKIQEQENKLFIENPRGMLVTPPGAELTKLFEKTLETNFTRVDLQYLQQNLPKLLIENLEIAQNFEMQTESNKVQVKVENSAYKNLAKLNTKLSNLYSSLGCPLSSAIASALAKATGKPIIIENQRTSEDGEDIEIEYSILEEEPTEK